MRRHARRSSTATRPGYVLFAVLLVTVVLSLMAYRFTESMITEKSVAVRSADQVQARIAAVSGIYQAAGLLADPSTMAELQYDVSDNAELFANQSVGTRARFSLINVSEAPDATGAGEAAYPLRYGIVDEAGKININALLAANETGDLLIGMLNTLPNMTPEIADSIANWANPSGTTRPLGATDEDYAAKATPYQHKRMPLNSIDELLLVQGVTPQLLFGNDLNRNGKLDANEDDGNEFNRGWSEYLTCYGREVDIDSEGNPRVNLNGPDLKVISEKLTQLVGQEISDYIVYYRISNTSTPARPLTNSQVLADATTLRDAVQQALDSGRMPSRRLTSVLSIWNTQIALPRPPAPAPMPGGPPPMPPPQPVAVGPINDPAKLKTLLGLLLDKCTCEDGYEVLPKINVNTAPPTVLRALIQSAAELGQNVTPEEGEKYITGRVGLDGSSVDVSTGAWLVTQAEMRPDLFKILLENVRITGRSFTYRVHSVGYAGNGGPDGGPGPRSPVARVEAVIDVGQRATDGTNIGYPRIVYFRDLTDLGRGFADLPGTR